MERIVSAEPRDMSMIGSHRRPSALKKSDLTGRKSGAAICFFNTDFMGLNGFAQIFC